MRYLKMFESKSWHYMTDYIMPGMIDKLLKDIEMLKNNNIIFNLYYHKPDKSEFGSTLFFKIYYHGNLTDEQKTVLKELKFNIINWDYHFSWPWIEINEDEIDLLVNVNKYNL